MPFGPAIAAVGSIGGALISSSAAKSAASTQAGAANRAADAAQQEQAQVRSDLAPFREAGGTGLDALMASLGLGGPGQNLLAANGINALTFQPTEAQLVATPGYQFTLGQGERGVENAAAAQGRGISGAALKGAANYATGLADNTLRTQQGIFQSNLGNVLGPLANLANLGQTSATQTGQNSLQATGLSNAAIQSGAASQAAGTVGSANNIASALGTAGNTPLNTLLFQKLLGGGGGTPFTSNAADPTADPRGIFQPNSPGF
jgi:hypothetical protein